MLAARRFEPTRKYGVPRELKARIGVFKERMQDDDIQLDIRAINRCAALIAEATSRHLRRLLRERNLSLTCHLFNGFGLFSDGSTTALTELDRYCAYDRSGCTMLPQQNGFRTDYHPFQTFAYASMAGIAPQQRLADGRTTLSGLAINSRDISIDGKGYHDLGHFAFAAAFVCPDPNMLFIVDGKRLTVREIIELALLAHAHASEERSVCNGFHLTEGVCAAAARIPTMTHLKGEAQEFLNRQLEVLTIIGSMIFECNHNRSLSLQMAIELDVINTAELVYITGHLIELAAFGRLFGYYLTREQDSTMAYVVNELIYSFSGALGRMTSDDMTVLCHFRRGITLLAELEEAKQEDREVDLSAYSVDFAIQESPTAFRSGQSLDAFLDALVLVGGILRSFRHK